MVATGAAGAPEPRPEPPRPVPRRPPVAEPEAEAEAVLGAAAEAAGAADAAGTAVAGAAAGAGGVVCARVSVVKAAKAAAVKKQREEIRGWGMGALACENWTAPGKLGELGQESRMNRLFIRDCSPL